MSDKHERYREAVDDILAATIHEVEARAALSEWCEREATGDNLVSSITQSKRLSVYDAAEQREEAAERYHRAWLAVTP